MDYKEYNKKLEGLMGQLGKEIPGTMAGFNQMHSSSFLRAHHHAALLF